MRPIPATYRYDRRRGFTLIEVLVAVGIIVLLGSILLVGFSRVGTSARVKQTRVTLATADALLADYASAAGERKVEQYIERMRSPGGTFMYDVYADGSPASDPSDLAGATFVVSQLELGASPAAYGNLGALVMSNPDDLASERYGDLGPAQTQKALAVLRRTPGVEAALGNLPNGSFVAQPSGTPTGNASNGERVVMQDEADGVLEAPPLLADAWGNPLVLVPSGGLVGVYFEQHGDEPHRITSRGIVEPDGDGSWDVALPLADVPAGVGPFWASGGADGNLATGDDNLYSFEAD